MRRVWRCQLCWMYCPALSWKYTDVSEVVLVCKFLNIIVHVFTTSCNCMMHSSPWWWRQYAPLKRRSTSMRLHGCTTQKAVILTHDLWWLGRLCGDNQSYLTPWSRNLRRWLYDQLVTKVHAFIGTRRSFRVHKSPPMVSFLNYINPIYSFQHYYSKI
jgi:hypothetical protein